MHYNVILLYASFLVLEEVEQTIVPSYGTVPDQQKLHTSEWVSILSL